MVNAGHGGYQHSLPPLASLRQNCGNPTVPTMSYITAPERFETDEFVLRSYLPGDGPAMQDATNSSYEHLKTFMPWACDDQTSEEAEQLVRQFRGRWLLSQEFVVALFSRDESQLLGGGGFHLREGSLATKSAEIGMWIRASSAGHGVGTSFLTALIEWGFTAWPWERLSWRCDSRNLASIRIAEKAGMQAEGVLRSHKFAPSGERRDTSCFAILRDSKR